MTRSSQHYSVVAMAPLLLLLGCSGVSADGASLGDENVGQLSQASACSNPGNKRVSVSSYTGNQNGFSREWAETYYPAVGRHATSGCSGVHIGKGFYLSAGSCNYQVGDHITFGAVAMSVGSVVAVRNDAQYNYALVTINTEADIQVGFVRLGYRVPAANEKIAALMADTSGAFIVGGTVTDNNVLPNRIRHRLDTPVPSGTGAPIFDENGYLVAIQTDNSCSGGSGQNGAMKVKNIIDDSWDLTFLAWTTPCTGSTKNTQWVQHSTNLIYTDVSTQACGFSGDVTYFSSLTSPGDTNIADTISASAIYLQTNQGFRIYVERPGLTVSQAQNANWKLNWQGFMLGWDDEIHHYRCANSTRYEANNWVSVGANEILQDITIPPGCSVALHREAGDPPSIRGLHLSLEGTMNPRQATGVNSTHLDSEGGFRVYLQRSGGITPAQASSWNWHVNYEVSDIRASGRMEAVGETPKPKLSGDGQPGWKLWTNNGVYLDVPNPAGWLFTPKYFPNLKTLPQADLTWGASPPLPPANTVKGTTSVYNPTKTGFRLYVKTSASVAQANSWWRVNWVAVP